MTIFASLEEMLVASAEAVRPPERLTVSQAAERYHIVNNPGTHVGPFSNEKTPYNVEPMDELQSLNFTGEVYVGPARSGKSVNAINWLCSTAICDPADMMFINMTQASARDWSQGDLAKALRYSPELRQRLSPGRQNDNVHDKRFLSGMRLLVKWPTISELSGKTIPRLWLFDYDRMPQDVDKEGSPFDLARKRAQTYRRFGMCVAESSPGFEIENPKWMATSPHEAPPTRGILALYNRGDRRRWYWRCPHCADPFEGDFKLLKYPDSVDPMEAAEAAEMSCPSCGALIPQSMRNELNAGGRWVKEGQVWMPDGTISGVARRSDIASFWLKGPAAAFVTWKDLVHRYLLAQQEYENTGSEESLKVTVNVDQGLPYSPKSVEAGRLPEELKERAQHYSERGVVPLGVGFLVTTIDVQAGGRPSFVCHTYGIGEGGDIWHVDMWKIRKSNRLDADGERKLIDPAGYPEDWDVLVDEVLERTYPLSDGSGRSLPVKIVACDSGGAAATGHRKKELERQDGPKVSVTGNAYEFWRRLKRTATGDEVAPPERLLQYVNYVRKAQGGAPVSIAQFDDDWEPIGPMVRKELVELGFAQQIDPMLLSRIKRRSAGLHLRFHLVKGAPSPTAPEMHRTTPDSQQRDKFAIARGDVPVWLVNSNKVKDRVANKLGRTDPGGQVHFPVWYDPQTGTAEDIGWLYTQLTTEIRTTRGWENPSRRRNEAFDLLAYCVGICSTPQIRLEHIDWSKPPTWADPDWSRNSMVIRPGGEKPAVDPNAPKPPSLEDLGDSLG